MHRMEVKPYLLHPEEALMLVAVVHQQEEIDEGALQECEGQDLSYVM